MDAPIGPTNLKQGLIQAKRKGGRHSSANTSLIAAAALDELPKNWMVGSLSASPHCLIYYALVSVGILLSLCRVLEYRTDTSLTLDFTRLLLCCQYGTVGSAPA